MALCPICFSESGIWSDDPILTTPSLSTEEFKGFTIIKPTHIIEIQNACNLAETEAGLTPSTWTHIDNSNLYQVIKTCVIELRTSIENVLSSIGKIKYDFFNYDKDGNYMGTSQTEWHDVDLNSELIQIKAIHIEDLRHPIPIPVEAYITVHGYNPESKEINTLTGFSSTVSVYVDDVFLDYAGDTEHTIASGSHIIKCVFNGITLEQTVDLIGGEHNTLSFTFSRTTFDIYSILSGTVELAGDSISQTQPTTMWGGTLLSESNHYYPGGIHLLNHIFWFTYTYAADAHLSGGVFFGRMSSLATTPGGAPAVTFTGLIRVTVTASAIDYHSQADWVGYIPLSMGAYAFSVKISGADAMNNSNFNNWYIQTDGSVVIAEDDITIRGFSINGGMPALQTVSASPFAGSDDITVVPSTPSYWSGSGNVLDGSWNHRTGAVCSSVPYAPEDLP